MAQFDGFNFVSVAVSRSPEGGSSFRDYPITGVWPNRDNPEWAYVAFPPPELHKPGRRQLTPEESGSHLPEIEIPLIQGVAKLVR
jgi:hypothetical protein